MTKEKFLENLDAWGSHRKLLWEALEATKELYLPVLELGSGPSSTPYLYEYCKNNNLTFLSYDFNPEYAKLNSKYGTKLTDWKDNSIWQRRYSVVLIDESPGEHRRESLSKVSAEIICTHDSEPPGWNASDYKIRPLFKYFNYMIDDIPETKGAPWTTCISTTIDVSKFKI